MIPPRRIRHHRLKTDYGDNLKKGFFVKPVEWEHLPKYLLQEPEANYVDRNSKIYCYSGSGFVLVFRRDLEEV